MSCKIGHLSFFNRTRDPTEGEVDVTVHAFQANFAVWSGLGPLPLRVNEVHLLTVTEPKLAEVDSEKYLVLYHGTTIEAATALAQSGLDLAFLSWTTKSFKRVRWRSSAFSTAMKTTGPVLLREKAKEGMHYKRCAG